MGRWKPDARGRLLQAAIDLFGEQGYEETTVAQIAERAGLTKATLFRHFSDKREILFQGQGALVEAATAAVEGAPGDAAPFELVAAGVTALCAVHREDDRDLGRRLGAITASSAELQERAALKRSIVTDALFRALADRLDDVHLAGVLADAGIRAYYDGFAAWVADADGGATLRETAAAELRAYEALIRS
ncbi:MAG TPA: helix-turn-helix domain-containing protein [Luteimicrobium sp.]|nr:helix-turn-helix domain-containing protein [Luteimicrobium sp.]